MSDVERNARCYVDGMAAQPQGEQEACPAARPDLYGRSHGAVRLRIGGGRIALGSLQRPGFASGAMPDPWR